MQSLSLPLSPCIDQCEERVVSCVPKRYICEHIYFFAKLLCSQSAWFTYDPLPSDRVQDNLSPSRKLSSSGGWLGRLGCPLGRWRAFSRGAQRLLPPNGERERERSEKVTGLFIQSFNRCVTSSAGNRLLCVPKSCREIERQYIWNAIAFSRFFLGLGKWNAEGREKFEQAENLPIFDKIECFSKLIIFDLHKADYLRINYEDLSVLYPRYFDIKR